MPKLQNNPDAPRVSTDEERAENARRHDAVRPPLARRAPSVPQQQPASAYVELHDGLSAIEAMCGRLLDELPAPDGAAGAGRGSAVCACAWRHASDHDALVEAFAMASPRAAAGLLIAAVGWPDADHDDEVGFVDWADFIAEHNWPDPVSTRLAAITASGAARDAVRLRGHGSDLVADAERLLVLASSVVRRQEQLQIRLGVEAGPGEDVSDERYEESGAGRAWDLLLIVQELISGLTASTMGVAELAQAMERENLPGPVSAAEVHSEIARRCAERVR